MITFLLHVIRLTIWYNREHSATRKPLHKYYYTAARIHSYRKKFLKWQGEENAYKCASKQLCGIEREEKRSILLTPKRNINYIFDKDMSGLKAEKGNSKLLLRSNQRKC